MRKFKKELLELLTLIMNTIITLSFQPYLSQTFIHIESFTERPPDRNTYIENTEKCMTQLKMVQAYPCLVI